MDGAVSDLSEEKQINGLLGATGFRNLPRSWALPQKYPKNE
jgi:hypothetical protein